MRVYSLVVTRPRGGSFQGCSVLDAALHLENLVDAEPCAPARVPDVAVTFGAEEIVGKGVQARDDIGGPANARSVVGEGHVARVIARSLSHSRRARKGKTGVWVSSACGPTAARWNEWIRAHN